MKPLPEEAWRAWSPDELSVRLRDSMASWYVVGGWALDLWHGHQTRVHEDLEFAVLPDQIDDCRELLWDLEFFVARDGELFHLSRTAAPPADLWQLWAADMTNGCWRADMMIERGTGETWIYKRDPQLQLPRASAVRRNSAGIPYLAPALVLLFKAKHRREKDEEDFRAALPCLETQEREALRNWLDTLHPNHDWIDRLRTDPDIH